MNFLGIHLTLLIGPAAPVPAPLPLMEALQSVTVTHNDQGRSGFQIAFRVGRSGPADLVDYPLLVNPLLRPFSRVIVIVTLNATPRVLMDGVITHQQLQPSEQPGGSVLAVTGEDVSVMMDLEQKAAEHPAQDETIIALKLIASYPQYGLLPMVIPPPALDLPLPIQRIPVQRATDLAYLNQMAQRFGYVFYVSPGPVPLVNTAYWGPPVRAGLPQRALSVNMGPATNVDSVSFQYNALAPTRVSGEVQDSLTNQKVPVETFFSTRLPPLVSQPALPFNLPNVRTTLLGDTQGLNVMQAYARAQGITDQSMDAVVTATGSLDALRYDGLLQPRALVDLRGAGYSYDGSYYVKNVTHTIRSGEYKQSFTLTREGVGALLPLVVP